MFSCESGLGARCQAAGLCADCSAKLYSPGSLLHSCHMSPTPSPAVAGSWGGQLAQPPLVPQGPLSRSLLAF